MVDANFLFNLQVGKAIGQKPGTCDVQRFPIVGHTYTHPTSKSSSSFPLFSSPLFGFLYSLFLFGFHIITSYINNVMEPDTFFQLASFEQVLDDLSWYHTSSPPKTTILSVVDLLSTYPPKNSCL